MRVRITKLHPGSVWTEEEVVGKVFTVHGEIKQARGYPVGWSYAEFEPNDIAQCVGGFKYEPVEEPAMSELAGWIPENIELHYVTASASPDCKITVKPKKKSWLQKIRDYDYQKAMKDYFKESRDMWQETAIARQARLENIGKRLKWKSGNVEFMVIVGNPVTYMEGNFPAIDKQVVEGYSIDLWDNISVCKHGDSFKWRKGVKQALSNFLNEHVGDPEIEVMIRRDLYAKYPELK